MRRKPRNLLSAHRLPKLEIVIAGKTASYNKKRELRNVKCMISKADLEHVVNSKQLFSVKGRYACLCSVWADVCFSVFVPKIQIYGPRNYNFRFRSCWKLLVFKTSCLGLTHLSYCLSSTYIQKHNSQTWHRLQRHLDENAVSTVLDVCAVGGPVEVFVSYLSASLWSRSLPIKN